MKEITGQKVIIAAVVATSEYTNIQRDKQYGITRLTVFYLNKISSEF